MAEPIPANKKDFHPMTYIWTKEESERRSEIFRRGFGSPRVTTLGSSPTVECELAGELGLSATAPGTGQPFLSKSQAERLIKDLVKDPVRADQLYDRIPESAGGRVIGTDLARELLPEYRTRAGKIAFTQITSHAAGTYAINRLRREIETRGQRRIFMMTAGGVATGKTSGVTDAMIEGSDLVYDGTLRDSAWAIETIQFAIVCGWGVEIQYLQRPIALAARGALRRANEQGRWFPLRNLPLAHQDAQKGILAVARYFDGNPAVKVNLWLNDGDILINPPRQLEREELEAGGPFSFGSVGSFGEERGQTNEREPDPWLTQAASEVARAFAEETVGGQIDPQILAFSGQGSEQLNRIVQSHSAESQNGALQSAIHMKVRR